MVAPRRVHVSNDMLACGHIWETDEQKSDIVFAHDSLSFGPVLPPWDSECVNARRVFRKEFLGKIFDPSSLPDAYESVIGAQAKLGVADEIIIWAGPSLEEQLFLVWIIAVLRHMNIGLDKVRYLLVTEDDDFGTPITSLSVLSKACFIKEHRRGGRLLSEDEIATLDRAWQVLCSPNPKEITRCIKRVPSKLSLVFNRIAHLKLRYPNLRTGLGAFDYRLLQICARCGPDAVSMAMEYLVNDYDAWDHPGDNIFHARLLKLGSPELKHPLLELEGDITALRTLNVKLTDAGKAALVGEANNVELNGIDEWVGGVHLNSATGSVWFYDPAKDTLIQTAG